jgi:hypothetical protein
MLLYKIYYVSPKKALPRIPQFSGAMILGRGWVSVRNRLAFLFYSVVLRAVMCEEYGIEE